MFTPRLPSLRCSFIFLLLLLTIATVISGRPFMASAETSFRARSEPARVQKEKRQTSAAPSLRLNQIHMMNEPRERTISPGFAAIIVGGASVVIAGLMV
ncbi:hypothetical protein RUND412_001360 [Rhizina undulata]